MPRHRPIAFALLAACTAAVVPASSLYGQQQPQPPAQAPATQSAADAIRPYLDALRTAPSPSTTIDAYARAYSINPQDPTLDALFIRRMVDLGLPDLAEYQAQELVKRDPQDGLAHAVIAYAAARRDDMATSLAEITAAAERLPADPFVVTTAAQLLAWYDLSRDPQQTASVPTNVRTALGLMRARLGTNRTFNEAYAQAREATVQNQNAQQQQQQPPSTPPAAAQQPAGPTIYAPPAPAQAVSPDYVYVYNPPVIVGGSYYYPPPPHYGRPHWPHRPDRDHDHGDHDRPGRPDRPDRPQRPDDAGDRPQTPPRVPTHVTVRDQPGNIVVRPANPNPRPPASYLPRDAAGPQPRQPAAPAPSAPTTITRPAPDRPTRVERRDTPPARPAQPAPTNDRTRGSQAERPAPPANARPAPTDRPQRSEPAPRGEAQRRSVGGASGFAPAPNPTLAAGGTTSGVQDPSRSRDLSKPVRNGSIDLGSGGQVGVVDVSRPPRSPGIDLSSPPPTGSINLSSPPPGGSINLNSPPRSGSMDLNNPPRSGSIDLNNPPRGGTVNIANPPPSPFVNVASPPPSAAPNIAMPPPSGAPNISGIGGTPPPVPPAQTTITRPPSAPDIGGTRPQRGR